MPFVVGNTALSLLHSDPEMRRILELAGRVAASDANVLITGESGTGKTLLAATLHRQSPRASGPFVTVSCANISEDLLESDLFGHEKGAFTGAESRRIGRFEQAHGGTLFLDEVSELGPRLQGKLLRVVQERSFERLSGDETIQVDIRLIASSGADLEAAARDGSFRKDLYYRLNVIALRLPALRERPDDIQLLADAFLEEAASRHSRGALRFDSETRELLRYYPWPGNVRELKNVVERAVIAATGTAIGPGDLPLSASDRTEAILRAATSEMLTLDRLEAAYIREVLRTTRGNKTEAARILGINRKTLLEKRKRYGIP
ncbi:MAG TPA: sigma-54 dependent transcriptional regulator [Candidatus Polarisedimenticolia bacterium]|nr:sigma-54 dependent transcriptional regulator [Candidatus Polarisedimenticolia bacterium]